MASKRKIAHPKRRTKQAPIRAAETPETPLFELPPPKPGEAPFTFEGTVSQMEACLENIRAERPAPSFTLAEVHNMVGSNYSAYPEDMGDALSFAIDSFDDIHRTVRVCIEALPVTGDDSPIDPVSYLLQQVWHRSETVGNMLNKIRIAGKKAVAS